MKLLFTLLLSSFLLSPPAYAQEVDDEKISNRVYQAIQNNEDFSTSDIFIISVNGYVMLAGQVLSEELKQRASATVAFASSDMRRLINELEVVDALDKSFEESDLATLAEIEAVIPDMSPSTIPVIHNGVVHLLGQVSREEGTNVANAISRMSGVKSIRISYEYVQ